MRLFVLMMAVVVASASSAAAQGVGVRAGVSGSPDQFYVGVHADMPAFDRVRFRPNVELGAGQDLTLVAFNLDLVFRSRPAGHTWTVLIGGGPAANLRRRDRATGSTSDVGGGLNVLVGAAHAGGFFTELKVGLIDSPGIKFGIGYTFR